MNHRQWKKNFKKQHGRNPNVWEDKKKRSKLVANVAKIIQNVDFARIAKDMGVALTAGIKAMDNAVHEMADSLKERLEVFAHEQK